jgi:hypothetical protein
MKGSIRNRGRGGFAVVVTAYAERRENPGNGVENFRAGEFSGYDRA